MGYWSFDERTGDAVRDLSGNGNTATVRGGGAVQVPGRVGLAYRFDGASCITAPNSPSLTMADATALTMMAWIEIAADMTCPQDRLDAGFVNWGVILAKNGEYEHGVYCGSMPVYQESLSTSGPGGAWTWNGARPVSLSAWHHVATTWDGMTARHYLDGTQVETRPLAGNLTSVFGPSGLGIGCANVRADGSPSGAYHFVGLIDEVALYSRALGADEIANYYMATK